VILIPGGTGISTTGAAPFNPAAHDHLLALGFTHERYEASWEDLGDAENGPQLSGGPAYDEYQAEDGFTVYVGEDGRTGCEWVQP
jgi:hypothetical protein